MTSTSGEAVGNSGTAGLGAEDGSGPDDSAAAQRNTDYEGDPVQVGQDPVTDEPAPATDPSDATSVRRGEESDPNLGDIPADEQPHRGSGGIDV